MIYGAIEAGGTKFVCAVGNKDGSIIKKESFPTTTPQETMKAVVDFFKKFEPINAIGIGSFGPIDVNKTSPTYGYITSTPKPGWGNFDIVGSVKKEIAVPVGFTTDVNSSALGEANLGAARGLNNCVYITVGTGIGGGALVNGQLLHGHAHPEMGHIILRRHKDDKFEGNCPYHKDCLEGLSSGIAINARWGKKGVELESDNAVWEMEAYYLAQAVWSYTLVLSPERIVMGGGVMKQKQLFPLIRQHLKAINNNYIALPKLEEYIVPPGLGDDAGIVGCILLAVRAEEGKA